MAPIDRTMARDLLARCRARGLALTSQRRLVCEVFAGRRDHPTAEAVYEAARARLPEIHRATVYRTLDLLVDRGLAVRAQRTGHAARFDPHVERHDHWTCLRCGAMEDLGDAAPAPPPAAAALRARGYEVVGVTAQVWVVCPACRAAAPPPADAP